MNWYYLNKEGEVVGPLSQSSLEDMSNCGALAETTQVCKEGAESWITLAECLGKKPPTAQSTPPPLAQPSNPQDATNAKGQTPNTEKKSSRKPMLIGIGVAAIVVLGLVVAGIISAISQGFNNAGRAGTESSFASDFGVQLDRDTAGLYLLGYKVGSEGAAAMGVKTPQPEFERALPSFLATNPNLTKEQRQMILAGLDDARAGRPNRLEGIDIGSLPEPEIERSLAEYCRLGDLRSVKAMASPGNVNSADDIGWYPLHEACGGGHLEVSAHLLSLGARLDLSDGYGRYPIHHAAAGGNLDLFKTLVDAGAKIDQKTADPVADEIRMESRRLAGIDPNSEDQPIHIAAFHGSVVICRYLIDQGISPNTPNGEGKTPLGFASEDGKWLASKADVIRLFDPEGKIERNFTTAVGPNGRSVRTNGVYLRLFKNGGTSMAHCLEFWDNRKARFALIEGSDDALAIKEGFSRLKEDSYYSGSYDLSGPEMDSILVNLSSAPDPAYQQLKGGASGDALKFFSTLPGGFSTSSGFGSYEGEFKFYAD